MSLKAWYPFDGNINNHGTGNLALTQTAAPTYAAGKVTEKALSAGGFKWTAAQANSILNNKAMSFAFWIKPLNATSGQIFGVSGMTPPNNRRFSFWQYSTGNDFHWSWQNENSSSTYTGGTINGCFPTGVWTHCAITYDADANPTVNVYINGEKKGSSNGVSNCSNFAYETPVIYNNANRHIQDFRVYDNCLTPREVKHLAQGLAWHCKMNSISNPNLITTMSAGGRTTLKGKYGLVADYAANADTYGRFNVSPALQLDKTYTLSFDVKNFPTGLTWTWQLWNNANYSFKVTGDGHYEYSFTPIASKLPSDYSLTQFLFDDGTRGTNPTNLVTFYNFKIEEGSSATQWCPHSSDTAPYAAFSSYANKEIDCSGYRHDALRYNVIGERDSARYLHCGKFSGGSYIRSDSMYTVGWTDFTMSAWVNPSSYSATGGSTDRQTIIIGGMYLTLTNGIVSTYCYGKTTKYYDGKTKIPLNKWSHIAVTYDKAGVLKIYVNGTLDATYSGLVGACEDQQFHKQKEIGAETNGSSRQFAGKISDVRIYATALSEADLKDLYNVATTYTEHGSLLTYEIDNASNVNNIKYYPSHTKASSFSEIGYSGGMKTKVLSDGSAWARIHWLDVTTINTYFANDDEVAFCNQPNRFSRMGLVDHFKTTGLPDDYTLLEYIQSSGSQYIDTGYYWISEDTKIEVDMTVVTDGTYRSMFGNEEYVDSGSSRYFTGIPHGSGGSYNIYLGSNSVCALPITVGTRFKVGIETNSLKQYTLSKDGNSIQTGSYSGSVQTKAYANITGTNTSTTGHIFLFANHNSQRGTTNAPTQSMAAMRLYGCKMYEKGYLVRNFIPCKNSAGTVGLYDTQTRTFYTTPTGAFAAGATLDGIYEFMLTYPRMSSTEYNRWTQTSSPNSSTVTGFTNITGTWTQEAHSGLRKHATAAVYDCDSGDPWYAPIGQKSQWTTGKYIPSANGSSTTETELWVRIDNLPKLNKISMLDNKMIQAFEIKEL